MAEEKLLSASQVAALMGDKWSRTRVHVEWRRGNFAEPAQKVMMNGYESPLWTMDQVKNEKRKRGIIDEE